MLSGRLAQAGPQIRSSRVSDRADAVRREVDEFVAETDGRDGQQIRPAVDGQLGRQVTSEVLTAFGGTRHAQYADPLEIQQSAPSSIIADRHQGRKGGQASPDVGIDAGVLAEDQ
jgi:hypothetical protein